MYVYFSAPMSRGEAWKRIHVLDQDGNPIELPFLVIDQELWDPAYQRLTLLFDPGRIKRGLVLNQQMGPPIAEGKQYTLVIDREWLDARGVPLAEGFRKPFRGGPADRTPPALERWRVSPPKAGTLDALTVDFPKPMDYGLMQRLIDEFPASTEPCPSIAGKRIGASPPASPGSPATINCPSIRRSKIWPATASIVPLMSISL